jgi:peptidyl-prolyl cis-trans isomerase B (cyclophilin B)
MPTNQKKPNSQKKPINPKKRAIQTARKRESRGRIYLALIVIAIVAIGVGWYVYSSAQSSSGTPDFAIAAPSVVTIHAGNQVTSKVNITAVNNFGGTVQLSATASSGLNAIVTPASVTGSGIATLTMSAPNNGTYTVTVSGTSGSLTHSVTPVVGTSLYATLRTTKGMIVVELYNNSAPKTVTNLVNLAKSHFYDNLVWHRIIPNFVVQTGDPNTKNGGGDRNTWGQGTSPQSVPFEYDSSLHNNVGYVAMASTGAGVGGSSQFYVNVNDNSAALDGKYAVFAKVIVGMDAANALANLPTTNQYPNAQNQPADPSAAMLISVTISSSP